MERPLLRALRAPCVLLIDEIDRADSEFEAFLLEFLSDFQITIPELGTVSAVEPPIVVLTSNRTRELHDALKRRCLYHWIAFPDAARERAIIDAKVPGLAEDAAQSLVAAVTGVRALRLIKPPGIAETIEWAQAAKVLTDEGSAWPVALRRSLGPAAQGAGGHRRRPGARRGARVLNPCRRIPRRVGPDPREADRLPDRAARQHAAGHHAPVLARARDAGDALRGPAGVRRAVRDLVQGRAADARAERGGRGARRRPTRGRAVSCSRS